MLKVNRLKFPCLIVLGCAAILYGKAKLSREAVPIETQQTLEMSVRDIGAQKSRRRVVIILSNQRSGSTFTGGFFGENDDAFYLYEPLFPFGMSCEHGYQEKLELLRNIAACDFRNIEQTYREAFRISKAKTNHDCIGNHICSSHKHQSMLKRYGTFCENHPVSQTDKNGCGLPLDVATWSSYCRALNLMAFKILRVCSLQDLESIAKDLAKEGSDMYVIELVRDPRGIVNSALKLELKIETLNQRLDQLCGRYRNNSEYEESQRVIKGGGIVSSGKYMRVRYEDIAEDPIGGAQNIYKFLGLDLPKEVKMWIEKVTAGALPVLTELRKKLESEGLSDEKKAEIEMEIARTKSQGQSPYGTTRNSTSVLMKWRKHLKMDVVKTIQEQCGDIMNKFGYKLIQTEAEKLDIATKLW